MTETTLGHIVVAGIPAIANVLTIGVIPAAIYALVVRRTKRMPWAEIRSNLGLVAGKRRDYLEAAGALVAMTALAFAVAIGMGRGAFVDDSPVGTFRGMGITPLAIVLALLYGAIQTALAEELLFRGLIAGLLGRRLPFAVANFIQAVIFVLPHLGVFAVSPRLGAAAVGLSLAGGLVQGWLRLRSGSVGPPWLVHGGGNTVFALAVAAGWM